MLYNDNETITMNDIAVHTEIPMAELKKQIRVLLSTKILFVVGKEGKKIPENLNPFMYIALNNNFKCSAIRLTLPECKEKLILPQAQELDKSIVNQRKIWIEGALIKIMKSRRTIEEKGLIAEARKQLLEKFTIGPTDIQDRIKCLLEADYNKIYDPIKKIQEPQIVRQQIPFQLSIRNQLPERGA